MQLKKLALIGAALLAAACCIIAAGCTETEPATDSIVGAWTAPFDDGAGVAGYSVDVYAADGTGYYTIYEDIGFTHLLQHGQFAWKNNGDGTYTRIVSDGARPIAYDAATDTWTDSKYPSVIKTRMDPITGIWSGVGKTDDGKTCTFTQVLMNDGTGYHFHLLDDGTLEAGKTSWTPGNDGTYLVKNAELPEAVTWTLDGDSVSATSGNTLKKYFADSYYYLSYLGKWVNEDMGIARILSGDGTGLSTNGTPEGSATYTWTIPEFGKLSCHYLGGTALITGKPLAGTDVPFTYDRPADVFVGDTTGLEFSHEIVW